MELGSEYNLSLEDLNIVQDNIFEYLSEYENCFYFDSGRSAIKHLALHLSSSTKILLPEYICESVTNCFDKSKIKYYKINEDFSVDIDNVQNLIENKTTVIFLMHYFGSLQPLETLDKLRLLADQSDSIIIEDTTHSIFTQKKTIGDYLICSIRKWIPISGGGVLYYNKNKLSICNPNYRKSTDNTRSYGMILKDLFIKKGFDCNREYRRIFSESEAKLDEQHEICGLSDFSKYIASCVSINELIDRRKRNFQQLDEAMQLIGLKTVANFTSMSTPLVYPIRVRNRDAFRSYLMDNRIYCAVHWPFDNHKPKQRPFAIQNADKLISLPIDQRYDSESMQYLIGVVQRYGGDLLF
ncbi:MAG: aminotransferase class I/II-fold pyridoxal phosphate-dependent enzyme [Clostridiales bacterium]|nr:aminotransferase class I/II-fold pyridoxal phosphate-dependent enzyme [Clostridiales bacterium]